MIIFYTKQDGVIRGVTHDALREYFGIAEDNPPGWGIIHVDEWEGNRALFATTTDLSNRQRDVENREKYTVSLSGAWSGQVQEQIGFRPIPQPYASGYVPTWAPLDWQPDLENITFLNSLDGGSGTLALLTTMQSGTFANVAQLGNAVRGLAGAMRRLIPPIRRRLRRD